MSMNKKLKIALIGYGKMGKAIEKMAVSRHHEVRVIIDNEDDWDAHREKLAECDVAMEFTTPDAAPGNIKRCFELDLPVVTGTTGWLNAMPAILKFCEENTRTLFHASNFSIGVNIFFELNSKLASMLAKAEGYSPGITETHHTQKLDAPSGTAISLAKDIISKRENLSKWGNADDNPTNGVLPIKSYRVENVTGTHVVSYDSSIDSIEIKHTAHNRSGFAEGAILAAEWVHGKQGVFGMKDLLNF